MLSTITNRNPIFNLSKTVADFFTGNLKFQGIRNRESMKCLAEISYHFQVIKTHEKIAQLIERMENNLPQPNSEAKYLQRYQGERALNDFEMYVNEACYASQEAIKVEVKKLEKLIAKGEIDVPTIKVLQQMGVLKNA